MSYRLISALDDSTRASIDRLVAAAPNGHFTQHPGWTSIVGQEAHDRPLYFVGERDGEAQVAALVRLRRVPLLGRVLVDVFRGPVARTPAALLDALPALTAALHSERPIALRIDPYWSGEGAGELRRGLSTLGYQRMPDPPWHTSSLRVAVDRAPDEILASFKPPTRRQVRKALRAGLEIREDLDDSALAAFTQLYDAMTLHKGASPRSPAYLRAARDFCRAWPGRGFHLSSWGRGQLLGAIAVFTLGGRAIYAHGASSLEDPELPKSHLLHYEAMQRARARGCLQYDFGGFSSGAGHGQLRTPTQNINYFKSGFGGSEIEFVGGHQRVLAPLSLHLTQRLAALWRRTAPWFQ